MEGLLGTSTGQEEEQLMQDLPEPRSASILQVPERLFSCKHCGETFKRAERLKVCFAYSNSKDFYV